MAIKKYSKDMILKAAYDYAVDNGLDKISIRKLADYIGCSVMPIYDAFLSKEDLIRAVSTFTENVTDEKSGTLYDRYQRLLYYGLQYPKFFLSFAEYDTQNRHEEEIIDKICNRMKLDKRLKDLSNEQVYIINLRIQIFIIGLVYTYQYVESEPVNQYVYLKNVLNLTIDSMIDGYASHFRKKAYI